MHPLEEFCISPEFFFEMTLTAVFDESGKYNDSARVVFAGVLATQDDWIRLSREWNTRLREWTRNLPKGHSLRSKEPFLHMVELNQAHKRGDGANEIESLVKDLAALICKYAQEVFANTITVAEFKALGPGALKRYEDPFYYAFEACMKAVAGSDVLGTLDNVMLVCDHSDEYCVKSLEAYRRMILRERRIGQRIPCITFGDDKRYPPLQAADMYAYCHRSRLIGLSDLLWKGPLEVIDSTFSNHLSRDILLVKGDVRHGQQRQPENSE